MTTLTGFNLTIDNACLGTDMLLLRVSPYYPYSDGKAQKDTIEGYKYTVVLPQHGFEQLDVKIKGEKRADVAPGGSIPVVFDNLQVKPYINRDRSTLAFSAQADGIHTSTSKR